VSDGEGEGESVACARAAIAQHSHRRAATVRPAPRRGRARQLMRACRRARAWPKKRDFFSVIRRERPPLTYVT